MLNHEQTHTVKICTCVIDWLSKWSHSLQLNYSSVSAWSRAGQISEFMSWPAYSFLICSWLVNNHKMKNNPCSLLSLPKQTFRCLHVAMFKQNACDSEAKLLL